MVAHNEQKLLVDTDAFCKLGAVQLLTEATSVLDSSLDECRRLPALPHMLRRGKLPKLYGAAVCENLLRLAERIPCLESKDGADVWLNQLVPVAGIDPGEAQLFASAATDGLLVLSGDKRALRCLKTIGSVAHELRGRIVVLEAVLISLCARLGTEVVRSRINAGPMPDTAIRNCFSAGNGDPRGALLSYYNSLATEIDPVVLWDPLGV